MHFISEDLTKYCIGIFSSLNIRLHTSSFSGDNIPAGAFKVGRRHRINSTFHPSSVDRGKLCSCLKATANPHFQLTISTVSSPVQATGHGRSAVDLAPHCSSSENAVHWKIPYSVDRRKQAIWCTSLAVKGMTIRPGIRSKVLLPNYFRENARKAAYW